LEKHSTARALLLNLQNSATACQLGKLNSITETFEFEMVKTYEECQLIRLLSRKKN